jgi:hypothetical protein
MGKPAKKSKNTVVLDYSNRVPTWTSYITLFSGE